MADHAALYEYAQLRGLDYNELCRVFREACGGVAAARSLQAASQQTDKIAPVQGYAPGIPWSLHLEAYAAYCKKWAPLPALIDLEGRNCRGGFHVDELDEFVPGWRDRVAAAPQQPAQQAVRVPLADEQAQHLIADCGMCDGPLSLREVLNFIRTIEAEHGIALQGEKRQ
jgi:hypothetical protein